MKKKILSMFLLTMCACFAFSSCSAIKNLFGGKTSDSVNDNSSQSEAPIVDELFEGIELPEVDIERP